MANFTTFEHAFYIGSYLSGIIYGAQIVMYYLTVRNLLNTSSQDSKRSTLFTISLSTALFILVTIDVSTNAIFGEQAWITFRNLYPGGPPQWIAMNTAVWYETFSTTSVAGLIFLSDAFLIYRCFIIWNSRKIILLVAGIIYLAGLSQAILEIYTSALPGGNFFSRKSINFGLPYYCISIGLNVILTSMIVGRVLYLTRQLRRTLGDNAARIYTSAMAILVESAALYSIVGIMTIIPYGLNADTSIAFGQVWSKLAALSPQLILFRVSAGRAWSKDTVAQVQSDVVFSTHTRSHTTTGFGTSTSAPTMNYSGSVEKNIGSASVMASPKNEWNVVRTYERSSEEAV